MPSALKATTLGECKDPELKFKNLGCDTVGNTQIVQSEGEMYAETDPVAKWMIANDYVNNEGTVNEEKDYAKYLKYCTGEDTSIPGVSTLSLEDDDYDWSDKKCQQQNEMMSNFRTYTARITLTDDRDTYYDKPVSGTTGGQGQTPGTTTPGGSVDGDDYKTECSKYAYCTKQCVDFVLFRLVKHGVLPGKQTMGDGKEVAGNLGKQLGVTVNTTPAVHAVMSSAVGGGGYGHTAIVSKVNSDGSFVVEEYNFQNEKAYGTRTITADQIASQKLTFAHVEGSYK
jgi:surface antigen